MVNLPSASQREGVQEDNRESSSVETVGIFLVAICSVFCVVLSKDHLFFLFT
jgi:hypothetical protein